MEISDIQEPSILKELSIQELEELAAQIRTFLITSISKTGGHLSSNLGVVELTMALHYVFNSPTDKIFFDVGHQSYVHKILTGRASAFSSLRKFDGLSGFQKFCESEHDVWEAGHSSTALSAAVGMAIARDLDNKQYDVIPVIGDAAMVGGMSLEALNHLGYAKNKVILILNDNQMSIGQSVGGFGNFLADIRLSKTYNHLKEEYRQILSNGKIRSKIFSMTKRMKDFVKRGVIRESIFSEFGIEYIGPVDGHDFNELFKAFTLAKESKESVVIHVVTVKGKGYPFAQNDATGQWHGIGPFDIETGVCQSTIPEGMVSWSKFIANHVEKLMAVNTNIVAVTPAMIHGSSMEGIFAKFPKRAFDVGIAEQHAITFAAGLASQGKIPFISMYSSFLQRAYDQINHDLARMKLPSVIAIDRAGLVGSDGPTHHGVFDISMLQAIPNLVLFAPKNGAEAARYLNTAFHNANQPYCLRLPRNTIQEVSVETHEMLEIGSWVIETDTPAYQATIITYGDNVEKVMAHFATYKIAVRVINARFIKPLDSDMLDIIIESKAPIIVYETDMKIGGLAASISHYYVQKGVTKEIVSIGIEDHYSKQGSIAELEAYEKIDLEHLQKVVEEKIRGKRKN